MLMCNKTVTLIHHVREADTDTYVCTQIPNCSWYSRIKAAMTDKGMTMMRLTHIRFPALPAGAAIEKGDILVGGVVQAMTRRADLDGMVYVTIMHIADNRRGKNPHWAVVAE